MSHNEIVWARWQAWIAALNEYYGWELNPNTQVAYLEAFSGFLKPDCSETVFTCTCKHYHIDHLLVDGMRKQPCTLDEQYLQAWIESVLTILRSKNVDWSHDAGIDSSDLVQIACEAIIKSLASFRYNSNFNTWAYKVTIQSVQCYLRSQGAKKRSAPLTSLDDNSAIDAPINHTDLPEVCVLSNTFASRAITILRDEKGDRLAALFALWAIHDQAPATIARHVGLSLSRVRTLLDQARKHLREHPKIQEWLWSSTPAYLKMYRSVLLDPVLLTSL